MVVGCGSGQPTVELSDGRNELARAPGPQRRERRERGEREKEAGGIVADSIPVELSSIQPMPDSVALSRIF